MACSFFSSVIGNERTRRVCCGISVNVKRIEFLSVSWETCTVSSPDDCRLVVWLVGCKCQSINEYINIELPKLKHEEFREGGTCDKVNVFIGMYKMYVNIRFLWWRQ